MPRRMPPPRRARPHARSYRARCPTRGPGGCGSACATATPSTGRFTSADPTDFDGSLNLYVYPDDDPVDLVDPTGTHAISGGFFAGAGAEFEISWGTDGWTICILPGLGVGAFVGVDPNSTNSKPAGSGFVGNRSLGTHAAEIGTSVEKFTDPCGKSTTQATFDPRLGPVEGHFAALTDLKTGETTAIHDIAGSQSFGPDVPVGPKGGKVGFKGRVAYKYCKHWVG